MPSRVLPLTASALVALTVAVPAFGQGKSGGKRPAKTKIAVPPPSANALSTATSTNLATELGASTAAPFAWLDDASLMPPGSV